MKLNNKGWGTAQMLLFSAGILIALLVAIFFLYQLYNSLGEPLKNRQYYNLEDKLESAAKDYIDEFDVLVTGDYKLTLTTLKENHFIDEFTDSKGNECAGYVMISNKESGLSYQGYIVCQDYQTSK